MKRITLWAKASVWVIGVPILLLLLLRDARAIRATLPGLRLDDSKNSPPAQAEPAAASKTQLPPAVVPAGGNLASLVLTFGEEGVGPGQFQDARTLAVDGAGRIYVAEFNGGRVQVFTPDGKYLSQWTADAGTPIHSIGAARDGTVYLLQGGMVGIYDGPSGDPLGSLDYPSGFQDVFVDRQDRVLASWFVNQDDIIRFDSARKPALVIRSAVKGSGGIVEQDGRVAEDTQGNIFELAKFNNAVFKFSPEGKFLSRFGEKGDQPGQFNTLLDIAVDSAGKIYVSDFIAIQVFDPNGKFLGIIPVAGSASSMLIDDKDQLYVAATTRVYKYQLNP